MQPSRNITTIVRLLNNNPQWFGAGAHTEDEALALFIQQPFDVILLGAGIDEVSERRLKPVMLAINPDARFIQHYGGGSGLLTGEIYEAMAVN